MIKASTIKLGDRVGVPAFGSVKTRTVLEVGDDYVVVHICSQIMKVPEHKISSHTRMES